MGAAAGSVEHPQDQIEGRPLASDQPAHTGHQQFLLAGPQIHPARTEDGRLPRAGALQPVPKRRREDQRSIFEGGAGEVH